MCRHPNAVRALAMAVFIETKLIHSFVIENKAFLALVEAVMHTVRRNSRTVLALAHTELVFVHLIVFAVV